MKRMGLQQNEYGARILGLTGLMAGVVFSLLALYSPVLASDIVYPTESWAVEESWFGALSPSTDDDVVFHHTTTQSSYRWYDDDGYDVNTCTALAAADTTIDSIKIGQRLVARMQIIVLTTATADAKFTLQYDENDSVWKNVTGGTPLAYTEGASGKSGQLLNARVCASQTWTWQMGRWHEGTRNSVPSLIPVDTYTEFAFVVDTHNAVKSKTYRLRLVDEDRGADPSLDTYTKYPALQTVTTVNTIRYSKERVATLGTAALDLSMFLDKDGYADVAEGGDSLLDPLKASVMDVTPNLTFDEFSTDTNEQFSTASACGDVNADNYVDLVVGAPKYNNSQGRAYLYYGGTIMNVIPDLTFTADSPGDIALEQHASRTHGLYPQAPDPGIITIGAGQGWGLPATGSLLISGISVDKDAVGFNGEPMATEGWALINWNRSGTTNQGSSGALAWKVSDGTETVITWEWDASAGQGQPEEAYAWIGEFSGFSNCALDVAGENDTFVMDAGCNDISVGPLAETAEASELAIAFLASDSGNAVGTNTPRIDWSTYNDFIWIDEDPDPADSGTPFYSVAYKILTSKQQVTVRATHNGADECSLYLAVFKGAAGEDEFGTSLVLGDLNNDNYDDLVVGADAYNSNQGRAYLYYGGASMNVTPDLTFDEFSGDTDEEYGYSLSIGDVDDDNYSDLIAGSPGYNDYQGRVYLYYGGASMDITPDLTFDEFSGDNTYVFLGCSLSTGDFDNDNYADLVVGSYGYNTASQGRAFLFYGGASMDVTPDLTFDEFSVADDDDWFGYSLSTGDFDNDNYADLVVGGPFYGALPLCGRANLYYGGTSMDITPDLTFDQFSSNINVGFAYSLSTGDVDNDNYADLAVGSYWYNATQGRAHLFYGGASMDAIPDLTFDEFSGGQFGYSLSTGDFDNDNYADLAVGANLYNSQGRAYLYYGGKKTTDIPVFNFALSNTNNTDEIQVTWEGQSSVASSTNPVYLQVYRFGEMDIVPDLTATGENTADWFGHRPTVTGDVNGDNYVDVMIPAMSYPAGANYGRVYLYYGGTNMDLNADLFFDAEEDDTNNFGVRMDCGDLNNDNYEDLVIGASGYNTGRAYLYYGGATMNITCDLTYDGEETGTMGAGVYITDINNDNYEDLFISASGYDASKGRVYLYYGSRSLGTVADKTFTGADTGANLGNTGTTNAVGDVNCDGYNDIIMSGYTYDTDMGRAYLFYGAAGTGMDVTCDLTFDYPAADTNAYFGYDCDMGDVNADDYDDVIIGAYYSGANEGNAYLYYGGATMDITVDKTFTPVAVGWFGYSVELADINQDAYADAIIGNYGQKEVTVYYGGTNMNVVPDLTLVSVLDETASTRFGNTITIGDVDADGYPDIVVSAHGYPNDTYRGRAYLFYGNKLQPMDVLPEKTFDEFSADDNEQLGNAIASGDVNGDNYMDITLGAYYYNADQGRVYLYYGSTNMNITPDLTFGVEEQGLFGSSIALGDINNDNYDDLVVGAMRYNFNSMEGRGQGRAYLFYGGTNMNITPDLTFDDLSGDFLAVFGWPLALGDADNDNYCDLAVGAYAYNTYQGRAYLYYGGTNMNITPDLTFDELTASAWFGRSLSFGDVDNNNYDDLVVGASAYNSAQGRAYIYYGGASMDVTPDLTFDEFSDDTNEYFGWSLTTGDFDADNYADLIIGTFGYNNNQGRAYFYYGGNPMNITPDLTFDEFSGDTDEYFGNTLTTGDLDSDNYDDLIIGAYSYNVRQGRAYLYYGGAAMNIIPDFTFDEFSGDTDEQFGYSLSTGDFDNDNYADLAVGSYGYNSYQGRAYLYYGPQTGYGKEPIGWQNKDVDYTTAADTAIALIGTVVVDQTAYYRQVAGGDGNIYWSFWRVYQESANSPETLETDLFYGVFAASAIGLVEFFAVGYDGKVILKWKTGSEVENFGYNIYRSGGGFSGYEAINASLILGQGTSVMGHEYSFTDNDVTNGQTYYYILEDVDFNGNTTRHGPVTAHPGVDSDSDGMSDDYERYFGLDVNGDDASADADGDGVTNLEEFELLTDPTRAEAGSLDDEEIAIIEESDDYMVIELTTASFQSKDVTVDAETFQEVWLPEYIHSYTEVAGQPKLPEKGVLIGTKSFNQATVEILYDEYETHLNYNVYPQSKYIQQQDPNTGIVWLEKQFYKDELAYSQRSFFPGALVDIDYSYYLRDQKIINLRFYPLQYNPDKDEIRLYTTIRVRINFSSEAEEEPSFTIPDDLYKSGSLKLAISNSGMYRVTQAYLEAQGIDTSLIDRTRVRIFNQGSEVAINTQGGDDFTFDAGDYIEFYAESIDSPYTTQNIYWLALNQDLTALTIETQAEPEAEYFLNVASFTHPEHIELDEDYWMDVAGETDPWFFWDYLWAIPPTPSSATYTLDIDEPLSSNEEAEISVCLYGMSQSLNALGHHIYVYLNGYYVGEDEWEGDDQHIFSIRVPSYYLIDGENTLVIELPADLPQLFELAVLDYIDVTYPRKLAAENDEVTFSANLAGAYEFTVEGFTVDTVSVFKIKSDLSTYKLDTYIAAPDGSTYTITFKDIADLDDTYVVLAESAYKTPASVSADSASELTSTSNQADYIIITPDNFASTVQELADYRASQGLAVEVVKIQDIYDEFNYGLPEPAAIREFLMYTYNEWTTPAPIYVLLAADTTYDYKDNYWYGLFDYVPTNFMYNELYGWTADDSYFVCLDSVDDILPDMLIGRLPAKTTTELADMITKIKAYEALDEDSLTWAKTVTFVADENDENAFTTISNSFANYLPDDFTAQKLYYDEYPSTSVLQDNILSSINDGTLIFSYSGHGGVDMMSGHYLFESADIASLFNTDKYPVVVAMDCLNGYFVYPRYWECLAEEFVRPADKGAVAILASSGATYSHRQHKLGRGFYKAIFVDDDYVLGSAVTQAKVYLYNQLGEEGRLINKTFTLFGDPALRLKGYDAAQIRIAEREAAAAAAAEAAAEEEEEVPEASLPTYVQDDEEAAAEATPGSQESPAAFDLVGDDVAEVINNESTSEQADYDATILLQSLEGDADREEETAEAREISEGVPGLPGMMQRIVDKLPKKASERAKEATKVDTTVFLKEFKPGAQPAKGEAVESKPIEVIEKKAIETQKSVWQKIRERIMNTIRQILQQIRVFFTGE